MSEDIFSKKVQVFLVIITLLHDDQVISTCQVHSFIRCFSLRIRNWVTNKIHRAHFEPVPSVVGSSPDPLSKQLSEQIELNDGPSIHPFIHPYLLLSLIYGKTDGSPRIQRLLYGWLSRKVHKRHLLHFYCEHRLVSVKYLSTLWSLRLTVSIYH